MTDKPTTGELSRGAKDFVRENQAYLIDYARPVFILMLIAEVLTRVGPLYGKTLTMTGPLLMSYCTACFMLAWHRAALLGPKREHKVNPFALKPGEGRFVGLFFSIALVMILFVIMGIVPAVLVAAGLHSKGLAVVLGVIVGIGAIILSMRFMFMLPARSVNAPSSWGEAWRLSSGLIWPLCIGSLRACILPALLIGLIAYVAIMILFASHLISIDDNKEVVWTLPGAITMVIIEGIPMLVINLVILARGVTVLSRLYQWSVQNVTQPATTTT